MRSRARSLHAVVGAVLFQFLAPTAPAGELAWSVKLILSTQPQVEVTIDTAGLAPNEVVDAASFEASFLSSSNTSLGTKTFPVVDAKLFVLESKQVYRRYYYAPYSGAKKLVAGNLTFIRRTLGDKADGVTDVVLPPASAPCCASLSSPPTVEVKAQSAAAAFSPKSQVATAVQPQNLAMVIDATRKSRCASYSRRAVAQNQLNLRRKCYAADNRWSSNFEHHNRYCMDPNVDPETVRTEAVERDRLLKQCKK